MSRNSIAEILREAADELATNSESPRLDAQLLLGKVLKTTRSILISRDDLEVSIELRREFDNLIARRKAGTPIAYLLGTREFWSLNLRVTPDVLVPRPETEKLVELALQRIPSDRECTVLDLGTGSGAIALAIASERPRAQVTGVDISSAALEVAMRNAQSLGLTQITWRLGSWFDAVPGKCFDLIAANPPYVASRDPALDKLAAEPTIALTPGLTGMEAIETIVAGAADHLHTSGQILLEHGATQDVLVAELLSQQGFTGICSHLDFAGLPRVTLGTVFTPHQGHS